MTEIILSSGTDNHPLIATQSLVRVGHAVDDRKVSYLD